MKEPLLSPSLTLAGSIIHLAAEVEEGRPVMKAERAYYVCSECGEGSAQWLGRCPACGNFGTMLREDREPGRRSSPVSIAKPLRMVELGEEVPRLLVGIPELDRVLGGGAVPGSLVLLGGEPGIGKSTLLLQAAHSLSAGGARVLLVSGEESAAQIGSRARRVGCLHPDLYLLCETDLGRVEDAVAELDPQVVIVDSLQTVRCPEVDAVPGGVNQMRESVLRLQVLAKEGGAVFFLVGHVTKEGLLAGPRLVEHMVDCVLYFEGERFDSLRVLRAVKNRFGSVSEVGIFEMTDTGLREVEDPSRLFLDHRSDPVPGTAVAVVMEGRRPLVVEVQALVVPSKLPAPKRVSTGVDQRRLAIDVAVLEKRGRIRLDDRDVYVGVSGGLQVSEPSLDLAVCAAVASSRRDRALPAGTVLLGEVSLTGEIRPVSRMEERLREASRLGFTSAVVSAASRARRQRLRVETIEVNDVREALHYLGLYPAEADSHRRITETGSPASPG